MPPAVGAASGNRRCLVIGAGLAGLSAAWHLVERGWEVEVLEAHPQRLGGRVCSYSFPQAPELTCELGGEWIGDSHTEMKNLVARFGLELVDHHYSFCFWNGQVTSRWYAPTDTGLEADPPRGWDDTALRLWNAFEAEYGRYGPARIQELDEVDWWTCLALRGLSIEALLRCDSMFATDFGESIRHVGGYSGASEYFDSNNTDEVDRKIRGGSSLLVDKLAEAIGVGSIRKGAEVTLVRQHGGEVSVGLRSGSSPAPAHACVCAIPAPRLRHITWDPPLPPQQQSAANQLQYARILKTAVLYEQRFWPDPPTAGFSIVTNRDTDFCFDSTHGQQGTQGILCSYAIGDKADDLATEPASDQVAQWITNDVIGTIEAMAGAPSPGSPATTDIKRQAWQLEPGIGGAYALFRPGQWFTVRRVAMPCSYSRMSASPSGNDHCS